MIERYSSGGPWEDVIGYSRAVATGPYVLTAGCTSTVDGQVAHVGDVTEQAREAFRIGIAALAEAGAGVVDVIRTRMYVVRRADADAVGAVHGEFFKAVKPVATMVLVAGLLHPDHLVEIELEAYRP